MVKSCITRKVKKGSESLDLARTRWDADGPNGPNTVPNSLLVLVTWWLAEGN